MKPPEKDKSFGRIFNHKNVENVIYTEIDKNSRISRTEWRYRYNPFGEREQKRMYNSPLGDMGYEMYPWVYYQLGIDNKQYAVYYGAQTNNSYVNMSNITMTAKPDPNRETVFFYPVEYNVYGNESSPKITYKYVDGYWQKQYKIYDYLGSLRYTISQMNKVLNYKGYDPYGNELIDTMKQTRQGYIGKENDVENGLGDHGVRKYEPGTGRFNSVDPMWELYYGRSPYNYCGNNPLIKIDENGKFEIPKIGEIEPSSHKKAPDYKKTYPLLINLLASAKNYLLENKNLLKIISKNTGKSEKDILKDFSKDSGPKVFAELFTAFGWQIEYQKLSLRAAEIIEAQQKAAKGDVYSAQIALTVSMMTLIHEYMHTLGLDEKAVAAIDKLLWGDIDVFDLNVREKEIKKGNIPIVNQSVILR